MAFEFAGASLLNFEHLVILWASIGQPSQNLWSFNLPGLRIWSVLICFRNRATESKVFDVQIFYVLSFSYLSVSIYSYGRSNL